MKQTLSAFLIIFFFLIILLFPSATLCGASKGLLLWFHTLLPTLLPFLILTNLLIYTNAISYLSRFTGQFFQKVFGVSSNGSFAVLTGFLCGYPVGAKVTADLVKTKRITLNEGKYLLSFCNNTSPAFITSFIVIQNLQEEDLLLQTLFILYLSPIICSFIFRRIYHLNPFEDLHLTENLFHFSFSYVDDCIMNAFETITKVGGYIILFSVLISLGELTPFSACLPILEITNGVPLILQNVSNFSAAYILILALTSFGGICAAFQTNSMLQETELSIGPYIIEKLITTMVTSLLALLFLIFAHH